MPYRYIDDIAIADAAFEAWGNTEEEMMRAAADALTNVMVENLGAVSGKVHRTIHVESDSRDMLLFHLLEEMIFLKDTDGLLLRISNTQIQRGNDHFTLDADAYGEEINPGKHTLNVDVKAVTLHRYHIEQTSKGWTATVVLDV